MRYIVEKLNVSRGQKDKIQKALQNGTKTLTLRFDNEDLNGEDDLIALTRTQIDQINKAISSGKGATIKMSKTQVGYNAKKVEGGFLSTLLGLATKFLPQVLGSLGLGALSGAASAGVQKAVGKGLYLKKGGCVCSVQTDGSGVYLKNASGSGLESVGDGLYLRTGRTVSPVGRGLLLGPNSPFKNIPILGAIL